MLKTGIKLILPFSGLSGISGVDIKSEYPVNILIRIFNNVGRIEMKPFCYHFILGDFKPIY